MKPYEIVYEFIYEAEGEQITGYFVGLDSQQDADWHAKNSCDYYKHKLISIKPISRKEYDRRFP